MTKHWPRLVLLLMLTTACTGGEAPAPNSRASSTSERSPSSTTTTSTAAEAGSNIEVVVQGGRPVGGVRRETVGLGQSVTLVVTSDVADEVHVHGYDERAAVPAGGTVTIEFLANIPGVFEVELEEQGTQLLSLEVTP